MKSQLIGRYSRLGFWLAGTAASQPGAGFGDPWKLVWISTGAFLSNPGARAMKKKKYLRNNILHRGGAVCISVIGFQWYSTERSGFDWFDHWSFDCDCMRRLWNYGMENYLILGGSLFLCCPLEIGHWGVLCFTPVYFGHEELTSMTLTVNTYVFVCVYADGNATQCIHVV